MIIYISISEMVCCIEISIDFSSLLVHDLSMDQYPGVLCLMMTVLPVMTSANLIQAAALLLYLESSIF